MDHVWKLENKEERKLLRSKARPFDFSEMSKTEINNLVLGMRKLMRKANGVGLSANQAGFDFNMFVAEVPDEKKGGRKFYAIFNPKLEKLDKEQETVEEGCLSVPGTWGPVKRHQKVLLTGFDKNGKTVKIKAWGLLARVFQHETDHLNGVVFIDKADELYTFEPDPGIGETKKSKND